MNEFTGERVIPGQVEIDLWNEHFSRYAFAAQFARGKRVLDVGCGSGYGTAELACAARFVAGVDVSADAAQYAREQFSVSNLAFLVGSASSLPVASSAFELVTAFEVIEHLRDWPDFLHEAHRVLSDDGLFLVSTPNKQYYAESRGKQGNNPFHVHEFEAHEFRAGLADVFTHVTVLMQNRAEAIAFYPDKISWPATARMDSSSGSREEAHFLIAVCSKQPLNDPHSFVYVPRAANVLREREQHIQKLQSELELNQSWLEDTRAERAQLLAALSAQKLHLEEQNRWALGIEREWKAAQQRIVELQDASMADAQLYGAKVAELEEENRRKTEWALETERRLSAELEHFRASHAEAVRLLDAADATLEERTRWALDLQKSLEEAQAQIARVQASRWIRAGRMFGVGPKL